MDPSQQQQLRDAAIRSMMGRKSSTPTTVPSPDKKEIDKEHDMAKEVVDLDPEREEGELTDDDNDESTQVKKLSASTLPAPRGKDSFYG